MGWKYNRNDSTDQDANNSKDTLRSSDMILIEKEQ